jgi:simple sugar transport system ATP-binding protein
VGRRVDREYARPPARSGDTVLSLRDVSVPSDRGGLAVSHLSLDVHACEIVALAGVQGNGQDELVEALVGLRPATSGTISLREHDITGWSVRDRHRVGMGHVPEDRSHDGVIAQMTVEENLVLDLHDDEAFARGITLRTGAIAENGRRRVAEFDIRAVSPDTPCGALSGGNQQKVVLARALSRPLEVLVICQPTRGVDVGAQESIYARIVAERDRGTAVVLVSTELDELLGLADRLVVMYRGEVVGELPSGAPRQQVGLMMAGVPADEARRQAATAPDDGAGR